jgi:hypothetical protein
METWQRPSGISECVFPERMFSSGGIFRVYAIRKNLRPIRGLFAPGGAFELPRGDHAEGDTQAEDDEARRSPSHWPPVLFSRFCSTAFGAIQSRLNGA